MSFATRVASDHDARPVGTVVMRYELITTARRRPRLFARVVYGRSCFTCSGTKFRAWEQIYPAGGRSIKYTSSPSRHLSS